jgi:hypothetical protein
MRRDFELHGSTLFVDRMGRPLNNKGCSLMTIAMLSGEKKVCLACEAIDISESVDAYAWVIKATVEMTPGIELDDIMVMEFWGKGGDCCTIWVNRQIMQNCTRSSSPA